MAPECRGAIITSDGFTEANRRGYVILDPDYPIVASVTHALPCHSVLINNVPGPTIMSDYGKCVFEAWQRVGGVSQW